jgi:hypothetical protein
MTDRSGRAGASGRQPSTPDADAARRTDGPASPIPRRLTRPSWLDLRLIAGVLLVLGSILVGSLILSSADRRTSTWAISRDLAAGTVLQAGDLRAVDVALGPAGPQYLPTREAVVGRAVLRAVKAGQLLPRSEVGEPQVGVSVTIPVRSENAPRVVRGDRITAWVTTKYCRGEVLVSGVPVQDVRAAGSSSFGSSATVGVLVRLRGDEARRAVAALDLSGAVIRLGVLSPDEQPQPADANLDRCAGTAP